MRKSRRYVFAITNAKTIEAGQEVLNERSEFRNLRSESKLLTPLNLKSETTGIKTKPRWHSQRGFVLGYFDYEERC